VSSVPLDIYIHEAHFAVPFFARVSLHNFCATGTCFSLRLRHLYIISVAFGYTLHARRYDQLCVQLLTLVQHCSVHFEGAVAGIGPALFCSLASPVRAARLDLVKLLSQKEQSSY
jgi:hypothetical protein